MQETAIPRMGFGTFRRVGGAGQEAIEVALSVGYRHLDTARSYGNEREVGRAIAASGLPRDDLFVTTKIWHDSLGPGEVEQSLVASLGDLGLDQVDLALIHWPSPRGEVPLHVYIEQLAALREKGLARLIGVSNFPMGLLERTIELLGPGEIATNQVEAHVHFQNARLAEFCRANGILVTCYQPLAHGTLGGDRTLIEIGRRHGVSPEQVALAFLLGRGHAVIPASSNPAHIKANFEARFVVLEDGEMARIAALDRNERRVSPAQAPDWD